MISNQGAHSSCINKLVFTIIHSVEYTKTINTTINILNEIEQIYSKFKYMAVEFVNMIIILHLNNTTLIIIIFAFVKRSLYMSGIEI